MYRLFVQDSMFISRLYLTESGRSAQHQHLRVHFNVPLSCNDEYANNYMYMIIYRSGKERQKQTIIHTQVQHVKT